LKRRMKTNLLFARIIVWTLLASGIVLAIKGQTVKTFTDNPPIEKAPRDSIVANGLSGHWLTVARFNKSDKDVQGYDPCYTVIFCKFKPMVKR
jgi:hypothetical protein